MASTVLDAHNSERKEWVDIKKQLDGQKTLLPLTWTMCGQEQEDSPLRILLCLLYVYV